MEQVSKHKLCIIHWPALLFSQTPAGDKLTNSNMRLDIQSYLQHANTYCLVHYTSIECKYKSI